MRRRREDFASADLALPTAVVEQAGNNGIDETLQLGFRRKSAIRQFAEVVQADELLVSFDQHRLVQGVAATEMVVDRGKVGPSFLADGLAGGIGITVLGEQPAGDFENPCAGTFAVASWGAASCAHGSPAVRGLIRAIVCYLLDQIQLEFDFDISCADQGTQT